LFKNPKTIKLNKIVFAVALAILMASVPFANSATYPDRDTGTYACASPKISGLGQQLTVNLWIWPALESPSMYTPIQQALKPGSNLQNIVASGFEGLQVTITKPDGTQSTFMPQDEPLKNIGILQPGLTQSIGAILFYLTPDQVGDWTIVASFPGQTVGGLDSPDTVFYKPSTSKPFTFTVQKDPINAGLLNGWPYSPLPTGYWTRPISVNNREWYQISGSWLQGSYDIYASKYNPYSTAPTTAHILWKKQVGSAGIAGGDWGSISMDLRDTTGGTPPIIMEGKVYYRTEAGGTFNCVDLRTGEQLFQATGAPSIGQHMRPFWQTAVQSEGSEALLRPFLWDFGSSGGAHTATTTWKNLNPVTGAVVATINNVPGDLRGGSTWFEEGSHIMYVAQAWGWNTTIPYKYAGEYLIKWDYNKMTGNDWKTGLVWNVTVRRPDGLGVGDGRTSQFALYAFTQANAVVVKAHNNENVMYGYDATTGEYLWKADLTFVDIATVMDGPNGIIAMWDGAHSSYHGFNVKTGQEIWETQVGNDPWGSITPRGSAVHNGIAYPVSLDGHVYALEMTTGNIKWQSEYFGDSSETIYGTLASYNGGIGADGKLYIQTGPIYSAQPSSRYNKMFCIDEATGKILWSVLGSQTPAAIADGYLLALGGNDGNLYCFGKGQTATSVSIQNDVVAKGANVLIKGSVLDQSPAQAGTPAVSDESMSEWMNYKQMQDATLLNSPPTPKGVQVTLTATSLSGENINIGSTNTDGYGNFYLAWTPTNEGIYTIQATFAGSGSYWSSTSETAVSVSPASAPTATPQANTATFDQLQTTNYYVAGSAVLIAVVVIAAALFVVKKRA
jgi:outer membrane protein assembly factor BamB